MSVNLFLRVPMIVFGVIGLFLDWNGNWAINIALVIYLLEHFLALFSRHSLKKVVLINIVAPFVVNGIFHNWLSADIAALILSVGTLIHTYSEIDKYNRDPVSYQQKIIEDLMAKQQKSASNGQNPNIKP